MFNSTLFAWTDYFTQGMESYGFTLDTIFSKTLDRSLTSSYVRKRVDDETFSSQSAWTSSQVETVDIFQAVNSLLETSN